MKNYFSRRKEYLSKLKIRLYRLNKLLERKPEEALSIILEIYPNYFIALAMYNCFWRYLGNEAEKGKISAQRVEKISCERDKVAKLYPRIEKLLQACAKSIGKKDNFDGDLLRYLTWFEMNDYLRDKKIIETELPDLLNRKKEYFYIFIGKENKDYVFTDNVLISRIRDSFFKIRRGQIKKIQGHIAYRGLARGIVYNPQTAKASPPKNFILVVSMTHPDDISLVKKCQAIVADEGGTLSHAAIVARELKKPCLISTKIATQVLKNGDMVEVNAERGIVKRIK